MLSMVQVGHGEKGDFTVRGVDYDMKGTPSLDFGIPSVKEDTTVKRGVLMSQGDHIFVFLQKKKKKMKNHLIICHRSV